MTVRELKKILSMTEDDAIIRIKITDENYNLHEVEMTTYEVDGDYLFFEGEEE